MPSRNSLGRSLPPLICLRGRWTRTKTGGGGGDGQGERTRVQPAAAREPPPLRETRQVTQVVKTLPGGGTARAAKLMQEHPQRVERMHTTTGLRKPDVAA